MMSHDSETVDDTKEVTVTDDSCTLEFIEIVPLDRPSDDYHTSEFIYPLFKINSEDLQELKEETADESDNGYPSYHVKQEPADEYETDGPCFTIQVSSMCTYSTDYYNSRLMFMSNSLSLFSGLLI